MSKDAASTNPDSGKPFGTEPRRSPASLYFFVTLFVVWFGVLLWLAGTQVGLKQ